jgi:putative spermidine/putrescine transport system substrate-binding protein
MVESLELLLKMGMSRRDFLVAAAGSSLATFLAACGSGSTGASPAAELKLGAFYATGTNQEVVPQAVINNYVRAHPNTTVSALTGASKFNDILTAYQTVKKPLVNFGMSFTPLQLAQAKPLSMFKALDLKRIPNLANIPSNYLYAGSTAAAPYATLIGLLYRSDLVKEPPTSWLDVLDSRFKGRVGLYDAPQGIFFNGLAEVNKVLGGDPATLDKGLAAYKAAAQAKQFSSIYTSNQTQFAALMSGQVHIAVGATLAQGPWSEAGAPIKYAVPKEGQVLLPIYSAIVQGSSPEQVAAGESILNDFLSPQNISMVCGLTYSAPTSPKVPLPTKLESNPAYNQSNVAAAMALDWAALAGNLGALTQSWNQQVKANM